MALQGPDRQGALYNLAEKHDVFQLKNAQDLVISAPVNEIVTVTVTYVATKEFFEALTGKE